MGFDAAEQELIRGSLRNVVASTSAARVPGVLLAEGWSELLETDAAQAITMLSEEVGAARASAPALDLVVLWALGVAEADTTAVIVDGGLVVDGASRADHFVEVSQDAVTSFAADQVTLTPSGGFDPSFGLSMAVVSGTGDPIGSVVDAERALAAGRRALASQMVGAADRMLRETIEYVQERHQYNRAIGSFQTVKHRLADVQVAVSAARAGIGTAWEVADGPDGSVAAIAAKCLAGRAQQVASNHCFQVHGGIAFTVEHGFQDWVRRGHLLDLLLGGHAALTTELGRRVLAKGRVPRMPDLY